MKPPQFDFAFAAEPMALVIETARDGARIQREKAQSVQIIEALNWALKPFATSGQFPFQIGTVSPNVDCPIDEVRDITCAEVIHKMLRWTPDAVTWFDYSTSPPTFNCKTPQRTRVRRAGCGQHLNFHAETRRRGEKMKPEEQRLFEKMEQAFVNAGRFGFCYPRVHPINERRARYWQGVAQRLITKRMGRFPIHGPESKS